MHAWTARTHERVGLAIHTAVPRMNSERTQIDVISVGWVTRGSIAPGFRAPAHSWDRFAKRARNAAEHLSGFLSPPARCPNLPRRSRPEDSAAPRRGSAEALLGSRPATPGHFQDCSAHR